MGMWCSFENKETHGWAEEGECQIYEKVGSSIFVEIHSMVGGKCYEATQRNNTCYPGISDDQLVIRPVCRASFKSLWICDGLSDCDRGVAGC